MAKNHQESTDWGGRFGRVVAFFSSVGGFLTGLAAILTVGISIYFLVRGGGNPGGNPASVTEPPTTSAPKPPAGGKTYLEVQGQHGAPTFRDPYGSADEGPKVRPGAKVKVSCKVYAPSIPSASPDGYWYLLSSPPWKNQFYVVANTFMNGGPLRGPGVRNTDMKVHDC